MDKELYFKDNGVFAENKDFLLRARKETDKEDYLNLCIEISVMPSMYDDNFKELSWKDLLDEIEVFVINKENNEFCGEITLKNYNSDTPEIGINLLKKYRGQGIGYKVTKLFMETVCQIQNIEYFIVRIYSDNLHSQNLFKKFGAIKIGEEENEYVKLLREVYNILKDDELLEALEDYNKINDRIYRLFDKYRAKGDVIRYRIDV